MATPTLTKHLLPGQLGPLFVDVRAGGRDSPRPAVVIIHGFKGFKDWGMFPPFAERLSRAGFTAVTFNVSGSGVDDDGQTVWPERFGHNTFTLELQDIAAVVDSLIAGQLGTPPPTHLGLMGHSRGGGTVVLHAARDPRVRALVTWASISHVDRMPEMKEEWRAKGRIDVVNSRTHQVLPLYTDLLDDVERNREGSLHILTAAERLTVPWLIVHGTEDPTVPVAEAERLSQANRKDSTVLDLVAGAGHTFGAAHPLQAMTPHLERVLGESVAFFSKHLA